MAKDVVVVAVPVIVVVVAADTQSRCRGEGFYRRPLGDTPQACRRYLWRLIEGSFTELLFRWEASFGFLLRLRRNLIAQQMVLQANASTTTDKRSVTLKQQRSHAYLKNSAVFSSRPPPILPQSSRRTRPTHRCAVFFRSHTPAKVSAHPSENKCPTQCCGSTAALFTEHVARGSENSVLGPPQRKTRHTYIHTYIHTCIHL
jgi:hypothetical protein